MRLALHAVVGVGLVQHGSLANTYPSRTRKIIGHAVGATDTDKGLATALRRRKGSPKSQADPPDYR